MLPDKLIVTGVGASVDGEYDCDIIGMLVPGNPETLTNAEGRRIKLMTGLRAGELEEALLSDDNDLTVAVAAVVLARHGKTVDEKKLWDAPMGAGLTFHVAKRKEEDAGPPSQGSPTSSDVNGTSSGVGSGESSATKENTPPPTGIPEPGSSGLHPVRLAT
jgi:hypothetical protein